MSREKLPVKFFAHREVDNQRVEPGGSSDLPKFVLEGKKLSHRSEALIDSFRVFKDIVFRKEKENSFIPTVFKAKLVDDASAKSHRKEAANIFRTGISDNVIGLAEKDELIIKLNSIKETNQIIKRLSDKDKYQYGISCIDKLETFEPYIIKEINKEIIDYKVKLIDYQNYEENIAIQKYFELKMKEFGIELKKTYYSSNHIVYNLKGVSNESFDYIQRDDIYDTIFSIEPMPKYSVSLDEIDGEDTVPIWKPSENDKYATVGVLDSGTSHIPHLKPWLSEKSYTAYPEVYMDRSHGTFVSGIIVYGDRLENENWIGSRGVKLLDACVFPDKTKESVYEDELINNIRQAIKENYKEVKIWNLSISITREVDDFAFSDFAIALDSIQDEYDVLICKSAGNCRNFLLGRPKGRIHEGADSIRSLVVGSIANKKSEYDIVEKENPSPFSRIGRGPSYIIKPEVVHYGGNAGIDNKGNLATTGVKSFGKNGAICQTVGTSYSTPRITSLTASLFQEMDEEFDSLLLKGLTIHSSNYSKNLSTPNTERVNQVGFGKPQNVQDILYNSPNEVTLILRDEIAKGEYIDIMDFPMPNCLKENGFYIGQITVTLVYNPILEPSQRSEYCQSNIDIKMGTYDNKKNKDTTKRHILNPVGRDGSKNILLESFYSKRKMKNNEEDFALKERLLVKYGDKYYPVKKYAIDLSEVTESKKHKHLTDDKKWYLYLKGLFRDYIEMRAQIQSTELSQEFCLIITIKDPTGRKPVYDEVTQKLVEYNFWHNNVKISSDVEIRI